MFSGCCRGPSVGVTVEIVHLLPFAREWIVNLPVEITVDRTSQEANPAGKWYSITRPFTLATWVTDLRKCRSAFWSTTVKITEMICLDLGQGAEGVLPTLLRVRGRGDGRTKVASRMAMGQFMGDF